VIEIPLPCDTQETLFDRCMINIGDYLKGGNHLTMGYFDNLDNGLLHKYQKQLKNGKNLIDMFFYL
jgi:hypothetical protein